MIGYLKESANLFLRCLGNLISTPLATFPTLNLFRWMKLFFVISCYIFYAQDLTGCYSIKTQCCFNLRIHRAQFKHWKYIYTRQPEWNLNYPWWKITYHWTQKCLSKDWLFKILLNCVSANQLWTLIKNSVRIGITNMKKKPSNLNLLQMVIWNMSIFFKELMKVSYFNIWKLWRRKDGTFYIITYFII